MASLDCRKRTCVAGWVGPVAAAYRMTNGFFRYCSIWHEVTSEACGRPTREVRAGPLQAESPPDRALAGGGAGHNLHSNVIQQKLVITRKTITVTATIMIFNHCQVSPTLGLRKLFWTRVIDYKEVLIHGAEGEVYLGLVSFNKVETPHPVFEGLPSRS